MHVSPLPPGRHVGLRHEEASPQRPARSDTECVHVCSLTCSYTAAIPGGLATLPLNTERTCIRHYINVVPPHKTGRIHQLKKASALSSCQCSCMQPAHSSCPRHPTNPPAGVEGATDDEGKLNHRGDGHEHEPKEGEEDESEEHKEKVPAGVQVRSDRVPGQKGQSMNV